MEGQTNCVLCDYKSRNIGSLKQHMESKHNVINMTIVQVLTQHVTDLESELKAKEQLIKQAEVDLNVIKEALRKEKESLQEKDKAFDDNITSQKKKAVEETKLVEEINATKELLRRCYEDLETKTSALNKELEKVKVPKVLTEMVPERKEVATQTISRTNEALNMKQEESNDNIKEKKIEMPCKYFNSIKGCRRGKQCWFYHGQSHEENKKIKLQQKPTKKFKVEQNKYEESKQKQGANLKQVIFELVHILLRESDI